MHYQEVKPTLSLGERHTAFNRAGGDSPDFEYPSDEDSFLTDLEERSSLSYPKEYIDLDTDEIGSSNNDYQQPSKPTWQSMSNYEPTGTSIHNPRKEPQLKQTFVDSYVQHHEPSLLPSSSFQKSARYSRSDETGYDQEQSFSSFDNYSGLRSKYLNEPQIKTNPNSQPCRVLKPHLNKHVENSQLMQFGDANDHIKQITMKYSSGSFHPLQMLSQNKNYAESQQNIFADDDSFTCRSNRDDCVYSTENVTSRTNNDSHAYHEVPSQNRDLMYFTDTCRLNQKTTTSLATCEVGEVEIDSSRQSCMQTNQASGSDFNLKYLTREQCWSQNYYDSPGKQMKTSQRFPNTQNNSILRNRSLNMNKYNGKADILDGSSMSGCVESSHLGSNIVRTCQSDQNNSIGQNVSYLQNVLSRTSANPYQNEANTTISKQFHHPSVETQTEENRNDFMLSRKENMIISNKPLSRVYAKETNLATEKDNIVCKAFPNITNLSKSDDNSFEVDDIFGDDDEDSSLISEGDNETFNNFEPNSMMDDVVSFPLTPIFCDNLVCEKEVVNKSKNIVKPRFCSIEDLNVQPEDIHGKPSR